jgi:hypothetical protein
MQLWKEYGKNGRRCKTWVTHTSSCYHVLQEQQQRHIEQRQQQRTASVQLQPPLQGRLKCNVDANFYNEGHVNGWGWCIRDYRKWFIVAGSNFLCGRLNTIERETMTIREATLEVIQIGSPPC